MAEKTGKVYIKWVRSGIGFPRRQKDMVKSLGLRRLNQVVERPDTAHIRGLVASVPHLVELVEPPARPAWFRLPEYRIVETRLQSVATPKKAGEEAPAETPAASADVESATVSPREETAATESTAASSPKRAGVTEGRASESAKGASAGSEKDKRQRKTAEPEPAAEE